MGRRKKEVVEETIKETTIEESSTENKEEHSKNNTSIKYSGSVNVTIKQGNRVISNRRSSNAGGDSIFKFLAECVSGNYSAAEEIRPCKIMLFRNTETAPENAKDDTGNISLCNFKYLENIGQPTDARVTEDSGIIFKWSITLHFRVPYSWLRATADLGINTVCLYGKSTELPSDGSLGNYSAKYYFTKEENDQTV
ncbi:MAG: hypothetical protein J6W64_00230 [Bacilli bacterium]|nr:hypothetical protein [Bacilli bacterium]